MPRILNRRLPIVAMLGLGLALFALPARAQLEWRATHPGVFRTGAFHTLGNGLLLTPQGRGHWIFLQQDLPPAYTFQFEQPAASGRTGSPGLEWKVIWNFWPYASVLYGFGAGFTHRLVFKADGAVLAQAGKRSVALDAGTDFPRRWRIQVSSERTRIFLGGRLMATLPAVRGAKPVPALAIKVQTVNGPGRRATPEAPNRMHLRLRRVELQMEPGAQAVPRPRLLQWPLPGREQDERLTVYAAAHLPLPPKKEMARLASLFHQIERAAGSRFEDHDIVVTAMFEPGQCCWNGTQSSDDGAGWTFVEAASLRPHVTTAHEFAHSYGCAGGHCDHERHKWLWEGFASYLGNRALNAVEGRPQWAFDIHWSNPFRFPEPWQAGGINDPPLTLHRSAVAANHGGEAGWELAAYSKGYTLLALLSELAGYGNLTGSIAANRGRNDVTSLGLLAALERRSGKKLSHLRPGWLEPGAYRRFNPAQGRDSDGDGLADFQERIAGSDPHAHDSDGDGQTDYEERRWGTDPRDPDSRMADKPWRLDGFPGDFPADDVADDVVGGSRRFPAGVGAGAEKGAAAGSWRALLLRLADGVLRGAVLPHPDHPPGPALDIAGLIVSDGQGHRLKVTWRGNRLNELEWLDGFQGPTLPSSRFKAACTRFGCEFEIPAHPFPPGKLGLSFYRGGFRDGNWVQSAEIGGVLEDFTPTGKP